MKTWYSVADNPKADIAELSIYSEIGGWGVSVEDFAADFNAIRNRKSINLYINSPGGNVFDGLTMYNLLSSVHDKLTVEVLGLAASAASVVALAGKELVMAPGTFFMIHNPSVDTQGNSTSLRKDADTLDKIANQILNIYAAHSNLTIDELAKMLEDETWLNADEALKYGFATSVNKELKAVACLYNLDAKGFKHIPRNLARPQVSLNNMDIREFETFLREVGMSRQDATLVASKVGLGKKHESDSPVADEIAVLDEFLKAIKSI